MSTYLIAFTAIIFSGLFAQSSPLQFRRFSVADGLSQQNVNAIAQDRQGFLWFGTQDGLNRFDGYSFRVFRSETGNSSSLRNNYVNRLLCTTDGRIWVGTIDGGLNIYNPAKETFTAHVHVFEDSSSLFSDNVSALYQDKKGSVWIGTWPGGLNKMDSLNGKVRFIHYTHDSKNSVSLSDNRVSSILEDREGNLWIGTWNGLNRMEKNGGFTRFFYSKSNPHSLGGNMVWSLSLDSSGNIWIGTWDGGLSKYYPKKNRFYVYKNNPLQASSLSSGRIRCVYTDYAGTVWVGTYDAGLDRYDPISDGFIHHRNDPFNAATLPTDEVQSLAQDSSGTFWVGTGSGIANFNPYRYKFSLLTIPGVVPTASSDRARAIYIDRNGDFWYGTNGNGLIRLLQGSNKFIHYLNSAEDSYSLSHNFIKTIYEQYNGTLWVGTYGRGLNRLNRATGNFKRYMNTSGDSVTGTNYVACMSETSDGSLWIGTDGGGLEKFNPKTNTFTHFRNIAGDSTSLSGNYVWALLEDSRKNLWVGTWGANLCRFDSKKVQFTRYRDVSGDSITTGSATILCIAEDHQEKIWFGTMEGLRCFDYKTNSFTIYTEKDGIASQFINCIVVDRNNSIWVSTNRGISRFDQTAKTFRNYSVSEGLQGIEFDQSVYAKDPQGRIYFGGLGGINYFDPDSVRDNPFIPSVRITRMKVMEQPFSLVNISDEGIVLNHDQNFLSFEYTALSYAAPEKNQYAYMLEGLDTGWVQAGTRRYASYTALPPGTYVFRVRGSNNDGVWNLDGASLRIVITPPFWRRWWFVAFAVAGILLSAVSFVRARERRLLAIERMRTRIARDLHDEIGSNLTGIAMSSQLIKQQKNLSEEEQEQLTEIGATALHTSELMRDIVWLINPGNDSLEELIARMKSTAYMLLGAIEHTFGFVMETREQNIALELKQNIFLIYKEALNNIAKHSSATKVDISVNVKGELLALHIADNGIGFDSSRSAMGNGLRNMQNRAHSIRGNFKIESEKGKGTVIVLTANIT